MTEQGRYAVSARFVGVMRKAKSPEKMFVISILWSDDKQINIYRSFEDFRKFHLVLKKRFSKESTLRKSTRYIPKFSAGARKCSLQKGLTKAMCRLMFLESYCKTLLRGELTVTQSTELYQFFSPQEHDLSPNFTKNSSVVRRMDEQDDDGAGTQPRVWSVTAPFMTQTYRCVAGYDTKDIKGRDFRVSPDDELDVLIKESTGWWLVENEDKQVTWFPAPYLELCEEGQQEDEEDEDAQEGTLFRAVKSYATKVPDEVSVPFGSVVEVLRKPDDGWWFIKHDGKAGYIPAMFLQPYSNPFGVETKKKKPGFPRKMSGQAGKSSQAKKSSQPNAKPPSAQSDTESPTEAENKSPEDPPGAENGSPENSSPRLQKAQSLDGLDAPKVSTVSSTASLLSGSLDSLDRRRSASASSSSSNVSSRASDGSDGGCSTPDICLISLVASNPRSSPPPNPPGPDLTGSSDPNHNPSDTPQVDLSDTPLADRSDMPLVDFSDLPLTEPLDQPPADPGDIPLVDLKSQACPSSPRMPPRPEASDIQSRCSTMTCKVAEVTTAELQA